VQRFIIDLEPIYVTVRSFVVGCIRVTNSNTLCWGIHWPCSGFSVEHDRLQYLGRGYGWNDVHAHLDIRQYKVRRVKAERYANQLNYLYELRMREILPIGTAVVLFVE